MASKTEAGGGAPCARVVVDDVRGALLSVKVVPGASRNRIIGLHGNSLKLCVSAAAEDGAANAALLSVLARALGVRVADLTIVSGRISPNKRVVIAGQSAAQVAARLAIRA